MSLVAMKPVYFVSAAAITAVVGIGAVGRMQARAPEQGGGQASANVVVARFGAIGLHARVSSRRLLPALAVLAVAGMSVTLATANPVVAVLGFASLGTGVALLVPTPLRRSRQSKAQWQR